MRLGMMVGALGWSYRWGHYRTRACNTWGIGRSFWRLSFDLVLEQVDQRVWANVGSEALDLVDSYRWRMNRGPAEGRSECLVEDME